MDENENNPLPSATLELTQIATNAFTNVPNMYVNGFVNGLGTGDIYVVYQMNGQTSVVINMTPSLAKTLANSLSAMVAQYESDTGQKVLTLQELQ